MQVNRYKATNARAIPNPIAVSIMASISEKSCRLREWPTFPLQRGCGGHDQAHDQNGEAEHAAEVQKTMMPIAALSLAGSGHRRNRAVSACCGDQQANEGDCQVGAALIGHLPGKGRNEFTGCAAWSFHRDGTGKADCSSRASTRVARDQSPSAGAVTRMRWPVRDPADYRACRRRSPCAAGNKIVIGRAFLHVSRSRSNHQDPGGRENHGAFAARFRPPGVGCPDRAYEQGQWQGQDVKEKGRHAVHCVSSFGRYMPTAAIETRAARTWLIALGSADMRAPAR